MAKEKFRLDSKTGEFVSVMTEQGQEIPDPVPMAPPVGFIQQRPLHERIREMVQHEFLRRKQEEDVESPEEADDFIVGDEDDPRYGERFAMLPGHEHEWEENYEPPKDFKDMRQRLVEAGWTPPQSDVEKREVSATEKGQEAPSVQPMKSSGSKEPLDASQSPQSPVAPARRR